MSYNMTQEFVISGALIDLDDFELGEKIGKGSFGTVLRSKNKKTGEIVAVKVMHKADILSNKKQQVNVLREITVPLILNLPGIVKLKGFRFPLTDEEKTKDKLLKLKPTPDNKLGIELDLTGAIIVTEFMPNGSLETITTDYLKTKGKSHEKMNPTIRSKIIFGIAATMKRVHLQNVIHRDLKLQNVFLDEKLEPRIADFGLAKVVMNKVDMTLAIGTPFYMAPELFNDETYDVSVDVYAFAFIIYKLFSLGVKFRGVKNINNTHRYMKLISEGERPMRPESIPDCYWELIQQCWKQNTSERPTFEEITEKLKGDEFAIKEFDMETDLDDLHEYQDRIDKDLQEEPVDFTKSQIINFDGKAILSKSGNFHNASTYKREGRDVKFNWKRH